MVNTLTKKLIRDLWALKAQVITIALVVASGISVLISAFSTYESLRQAQSQFYTKYHFAEIFADLKRAPNYLDKQLNTISGVSQTETRIIYDVILNLPDLAEPASGRFISLPDKNAPLLNQLYLRQGRWIDATQNNEILVNESFAQAHHLKPGDHIKALLQRHLQDLQIVGIVLSPEYIYAIQENSLLPDNEHFGIFWMNRSALEAAVGMQGAFNNIVLTLAPNGNKNLIIETLNKLFASYGILAAYDRNDQISDRFVTNEIKQQKILATSIPPIFLIVASFLLNIVANRLVTKQREQIATLKSLGYSNWTISMYYLKFVLVIVILGAITGTVLGIWLGQRMTVLYSEYFRFPSFNFQFSWWIPLIGVLISLMAAGSGVLNAIRVVTKLAPAEAMRPPSPTSYHKLFFEQFKLFNLLSPSTKIILRYLFRRPIRSFTTSFSVALSVAIIVLGLFWGDAIRYIIDNQFLKSKKEDALITFTEPIPDQALLELQHIKGIIFAEGYRIAPARISFQHYSYLTGIFGIPENSQLKLLLDNSSRVMPIPLHGILMSNMLAEKLHAKLGDKIRVEILVGTRATTEMQLLGLVNDYIGEALYTNINTVNRLLSEDRLITNAGITIDSHYTKSVYNELKNLTNISSVTVKQLLIDSFENTFAKHILVFTTFLACFAIVITVGVIYNSTRISLAERTWELATLRVLGFTIGEVSKILLGEIMIEILLSIPMGFLIGYFLARLALYWMQTDWFKIPLIIEPKTYAFAAFITLFSGVVSAYLVQRKVKQFDLVSVLKVTD